ncbi:uncharacterized protein [Anabrus simplex]|uniref:uncharacterized protein n=1 Tax=Anabrus simplex TaxID=316456 RepID=UPI0034DDB84C
MDFIDSELLILEVQKHPCVYDMKNQGYKDRDVKARAWTTISKALVGEKWEELEPEERNNIGKEIQKRWKSLRDSYTRALKFQESKNGGATKGKRPYVFYRKMSFLQSCIQLTESSRSTDESVLQAGSKDDGKTELNNSALSDRITNKITPREPKKRKCDTDTFEKEVMDVLKSNASQPQQDPDEMFFLSLIPYVKSMNSSNKLNFQIEVMQLLKSYTK